MKRWTVMVVPQGLGNTRSLDVAASHLWVTGAVVLGLVCLSALLTFSGIYLHQRIENAQSQIKELERTNHELAQQASTKSSPTPENMTSQEREELERKIRKEYEASTRAIVSELTELYSEEDKFRRIQGLPPRTSSAADFVADATTATASEGKGGPPGRGSDNAPASTTVAWHPPHVIYGLARPSADLILQEIRVRRASLAELHTAVLAKQERVERMPYEWPITARTRRLTSRFGWRKDPINYSIRHHDGLDIGAAYGSPVYATGRGIVTFSGYEAYYGNVIRINHGDGYETVYAHLSARNVQVNQQVNRGDQVGKLGSTGRSTGPHLHYEVRVKGNPVDPEGFLP